MKRRHLMMPIFIFCHIYTFLSTIQTTHTYKKHDVVRIIKALTFRLHNVANSLEDYITTSVIRATMIGDISILNLPYEQFNCILTIIYLFRHKYQQNKKGPTLSS